MIYHRIQTIRNQIHELDQEQAKQLEKSGQMKVILWEYQEQMVEAAAQAAMAYKKAALKENPKTNMEVIIQGQEMTARAAEEIEQAQIMEELTYLYYPQETNPQTFTPEQKIETVAMNFPLGKVLRGVRWDNRPFVVFEDSDGVGASELVDGNWVESDLLVEISVDGAIVPMAEFEDWVSEIKGDCKQTSNMKMS